MCQKETRHHVKNIIELRRNYPTLISNVIENQLRAQLSKHISRTLALKLKQNGIISALRNEYFLHSRDENVYFYYYCKNGKLLSVKSDESLEKYFLIFSLRFRTLKS